MIVGDAQPEPGLRIYAIGDVHGCHDELCELLALIDADIAANPVSVTRLIFLGDYVDRGPENRKVINELIGLQQSDRDVEFLLGNHDERILTFINNPALVWDGVMKWGGARTLEDYGIVPKPGEDEESVRQRFADALPRSHYAFLSGLKPSTQSGDYFFCHAGVRPGIAFEDQAEHDLIWIRHDFLLHGAPFEKVVVHGHTPVDEVEVKTNRINIDTRCYVSGVLTAVVLEGTEIRFLQTGGRS